MLPAVTQELIEINIFHLSSAKSIHYNYMPLHLYRLVVIIFTTKYYNYFPSLYLLIGVHMHTYVCVHVHAYMHECVSKRKR